MHALGGRKRSERFAIILSGVFPLLMAFYLYGDILDPRNVAWLLRENDTFQHHIGWQFFRQEPWGWPLGAIHNLATEFSTSIVFTDSIPLLALPLKLFDGFLPRDFQYLGLVMAASFCLNGAIACRLLLRLGAPVHVGFFGALFIAGTSVVVLRGIGIQGHEALTAHWLILLAIDFCLTQKTPTGRHGFKWLLLLIGAVLTHFYLFFMVGVFWSVWWLWRSLEMVKNVRANDGVSSPLAIKKLMVAYKKWWLIGLSTPVVVCCVMWAVGYFHSTYQGGDGEDYSRYSAEVLTFFNPLSTGWFFSDDFTSLSSFFPGWIAAREGQYEGMAYVGAGVMLLWVSLLASIVLRLWMSRARIVQREVVGIQPTDHHWGPVWVASLLLFAFAIAGELSVGQWSVSLHYDILFQPLKPYLRSSGRMVWPLLYVALLITFVKLFLNIKRCFLLPLLVVALVLQVADLKGLYQMVHDKMQGQMVASRHDPFAYEVLKDDTLERVWSDNDSFIVFPGEELEAIKPFVWLAAVNHSTINVAYVAQTDSRQVAAATQPYRQALEQGGLPAGHVYLITDDTLGMDACGLEGWRCARLDGVTVVWRP